MGGSRSGRVVVAAMALLLAASCGGGGGGGSDAEDDPRSLLVLGDSFSSGEGTTTSEGDCGRGDGAYGALLAARWEEAGVLDEYRNEACTGARMGDVAGQLDALGGERFDVVVMTIGGNDVGYSSVLADCVGVDDIARAVTGDGLDLGCDVDADELTRRVDGLATDLGGVTADVVDRALAAGGRLVVLTYPALFEDPSRWAADEGERCDGVARTDVELLRGAGASLAAAIESAASDQPDVTVVDQVDTFEGHGRCSADPWINGLTAQPRLRASFHPNDAGHAATAGLLAEQLGT